VSAPGEGTEFVVEIPVKQSLRQGNWHTFPDFTRRNGFPRQSFSVSAVILEEPLNFLRKQDLWNDFPRSYMNPLL
jgi:hypothetical protein